MAHILIVDDDPQVLSAVSRVLEKAGHTTSLASTGEQALDMVTRQQPDLMVLDIIMPEMDGIAVCRRARADPFTAKLPILFLSAKGRPADIVQGLQAGGDDYLVKPFEVRELPARVDALLRRAPGGTLDPEAEEITVGDVRLHTTRSEADVGGRLVDLTTVEHRLLHYLMLHKGQPVATQQLLEDVWEYPPGVGDPQVVHVSVGRLRQKIEPEPETPTYIRNVRGRGYLVGAAPEE